MIWNFKTLTQLQGLNELNYCWGAKMSPNTRGFQEQVLIYSVKIAILGSKLRLDIRVPEDTLEILQKYVLEKMFKFILNLSTTFFVDFKRILFFMGLLGSNYCITVTIRSVENLPILKIFIGKVKIAIRQS